jgi:sterol desaturase/sphingolipid hydroxylase (fatty acid hydroxylase superfamily)
LTGVHVRQSIQHVNARLPFVPMLDHLLVSPTFHPRHDAIGNGQEGTRYGFDFGVLFPKWKMLFKTVAWNRAVEPAGIRGQLPTPDGRGRDYGRGMWARQWHAFTRIAQRLRSK